MVRHNPTAPNRNEAMREAADMTTKRKSKSARDRQAMRELAQQMEAENIAIHKRLTERFPLAYMRTDGRGKFLRADYCTCEVSLVEWRCPDDWKPTDTTCPIYDRHLALWKREGSKHP